MSCCSCSETCSPKGSFGDDDGVSGEKRLMAGLVGLLVFGVMTAALVESFADAEVARSAPSTTAELADSIFSAYIVPFEAVSVLLLAALIGAKRRGPAGLGDCRAVEPVPPASASFSRSALRRPGPPQRRAGADVHRTHPERREINLVAFGAFRATVGGEVFALFVIAVAAAEVGVGLAMVLSCIATVDLLI
ncbi:MAG: hypothetical protein Ct9H300mP12_12080 [Acidimicrobiales bacterium]|nr:MAG: hypothetical protein Ct9H300mP12_12080 [Acidimicrobiales bacterium]